MKLIHEIFTDEVKDVIESFHIIQSGITETYPLTKGYTYEIYLTNCSYKVKVYKLEEKEIRS